MHDHFCKSGHPARRLRGAERVLTANLGSRFGGHDGVGQDSLGTSQPPRQIPTFAETRVHGRSAIFFNRHLVL